MDAITEGDAIIQSGRVRFGSADETLQALKTDTDVL